jgi:serine/threonine-protein kinase
MGTVYLARYAGEGKFQRLFAIKVLHPHLATETAFIDMMRDEAHIAARLHHTNVVPILDLGADGDIHYVVMEYIEGPALSTLLKRSPDHRPPEAVVAIVIDALEGLHAAHTLQDDNGEALRLVHRDVSPPNILVGADGITRITDFGIAKAEARISSTRPGTRKGKLQYMSPEQIRDGDAVDHRTDVWAAGAVLWNALTASQLFRGDSDGQTIHGILERPIPAPSSEGLKPPSCFDAIILRALSRDKHSRYDTALDMADDLRATAAKNGLAVSKNHVARWVGEILGEELEQRRKAIREVSQRRADPRDPGDSKVNVLPPASLSVRPLLTSGAVTLTQLSHIPSFSVEQSNPGLTPVRSPPQVGEIIVDTSEFQERRSRRWVLLAVAGVALIAIVIWATRWSDEKAREREARPVISAVATTRAVEPVPSVEARPASPSPTADAEQVARARAVDEEKKLNRGAPPRRAAPAPVAPAPEPVRQPKVESKSEPKEPAAPAPAPTPAPADEFEKNPYLRR